MSKQVVMKFILQLHKLPTCLERKRWKHVCFRKLSRANLDVSSSYGIERDE